MQLSSNSQLFNKKQTVLFWMVTLILGAIFITGCTPTVVPEVNSEGQTDIEPGSAVSASSNNTIRVGVLATLEGTFQTLGEDGARGVELAVSEFDGEIAGKQIELIYASTNLDTEVVTAAVKRLVEEDKVDIVIGPLSGDEGLAVKAYAKTQPQVTFLNGTSGAQNMTLRDPIPNFFRFSTDGAQWMAGLGSYSHNVQGYEHIVTIAEDYSYPHSQVGGFLVEYCRAGGSVDSQFWVPLGTNDYSGVISAIPADIDAIYVALGGTDAVNFLRQYKRFGGKAPLIGGSITLDQSILGAEAIAEYVKGTAAAGPIADDNPNPAWKQFVANYQETFPDGLQSPSLFAHGYYVNTKALLLSLQKIDGDLSNGQIELQKTLSALEFDSPTGPIKLDHNRQAVTTIFITVVEQDQNGNLYNKLVQEVPNVNQTLGIPENEYLAIGELTRSTTGCDQFNQQVGQK